MPFNPMADSPFASWLLYGNDTPILDFLTNDSHLQVAQNVALGVAVTAGTIATGGLLLEAAPAVGELLFEGSIQVASRVPSWMIYGANGLGNALTWTTVPRVAVGVGGAAIASELPALENAFAAAAADELPALEVTLPSLAPEIENALQAIEETAPSQRVFLDTTIIDAIRRGSSTIENQIVAARDAGIEVAIP